MKNLDGVTGEKEKREEKWGEGSKICRVKEGKCPYFVNKGPCDCQKIPEKTEEFENISRGGGQYFSGLLYYEPLLYYAKQCFGSGSGPIRIIGPDPDPLQGTLSGSGYQ